MTVPAEEATAKYVPAAAVIRMSQALSGIIGHKGHLGGQISLGGKLAAQPQACPGNYVARVLERWTELHE